MDWSTSELPDNMEWNPPQEPDLGFDQKVADNMVIVENTGNKYIPKNANYRFRQPRKVKM